MDAGSCALMTQYAPLPPEWQRLMKLAEVLKYGKAEIMFQNGKPVVVNFAIKTMKLDSDKDFLNTLDTIPLA